MEILQSQIWQFIGVVVAIIALIVSVASLIYQARRKSLSVTICNAYPILPKKPQNMVNDFQIIYKGQEVAELTALTLRFVNDGGISIVSEDFETPVTVIFKKEATILSAEVVSITPSDLSPTLAQDTKALVLSPLLLNPKDSFSITLLVQGLNANHPRDLYPSVTARIKGVNKINLDSTFVPIIYFETPWFGFNIDIRVLALVVIATSSTYLVRMI
ncbi:MAG: hypothetical protein ACKVOA_10215 [Methylophilaceae bacterium]